MLDAIAPDAAVFEPEEVDVLSKALDLALKIWAKHHKATPQMRAEMGRIVHNLGRSRLKLNRRLGDAVDAATLAEEAADLMGYLSALPEPVVVSRPPRPAPPRPLSLFPAEIRRPPTSALRVG